MGKEFAASILQILKTRDPSKTMCPSEVLDGADKQNKNLMDQVRAAAILLAKNGEIQIVQKGKPVDIDNIKGPIRLRMPR